MYELYPCTAIEMPLQVNFHRKQMFTGWLEIMCSTGDLQPLVNFGCS